MKFKKDAAAWHLPGLKFNYLGLFPGARCLIIARDDHQSCSHTAPPTPRDRPGVVLGSTCGQFLAEQPRRASGAESRGQLILLFICRRRSEFSPHCPTIPVPLCYFSYCMAERHPKDHLRPRIRLALSALHGDLDALKAMYGEAKIRPAALSAWRPRVISTTS